MINLRPINNSEVRQTLEKKSFPELLSDYIEAMKKELEDFNAKLEQIQTKSP